MTKIEQAFKKIDRRDFLSENMKPSAGDDGPLPIGWGQTNSQPSTVAFMLNLLQPEPADKILDIGFGSGWTTALLAYCVSGGAPDSKLNNGKIIAVEIIPQLKKWGEENIAKYNFLKKGVVKCVLADGSFGYQKEAPYDKILVSAAAEKLPGELLKQLKSNGRLVIPIDHSIWLYLKDEKGKISSREYPGFSFVPLV